MTPQEATQAVKRKLQELERFRQQDVPDIIGTEAVRHFNQSFVNEGFTDKSLKKWPDIKRRDPSSAWYGFSLGSNGQNPNKKTKAKPGEKDKRKPGNTNFSPTRAKDKILNGETMELKNSIKYVVKSDRVTVLSNKPYASVHQFGEPAKIFGRKSFTMKARPFIGKSEVMMNKIYTKIEKGIQKIKEK